MNLGGLKMTDYERGYKDGMAGAALPNIIDNGDKIDGYNYSYKTDSEGVPYINIDSVRAMLAKAAQSVDRWISVNERLPKIGEQVLVCDKFKQIDKMTYKGNGLWGRNDFTYKVTEKLFWQPLPKPPNQ